MIMEFSEMKKRGADSTQNVKKKAQMIYMVYDRVFYKFQEIANNTFRLQHEG